MIKNLFSLWDNVFQMVPVFYQTFSLIYLLSLCLLMVLVFLLSLILYKRCVHNNHLILVSLILSLLVIFENNLRFLYDFFLILLLSCLLLFLVFLLILLLGTEITHKHIIGLYLKLFKTY
jgi:hypothetical protein